MLFGVSSSHSVESSQYMLAFIPNICSPHTILSTPLKGRDSVSQISCVPGTNIELAYIRCSECVGFFFFFNLYRGLDPIYLSLVTSAHGHPDIPRPPLSHGPCPSWIMLSYHE